MNISLSIWLGNALKQMQNEGAYYTHMRTVLDKYGSPDVNFTNILQAAFSYKSFFAQQLCAYNLGL